MSRFRKGHIITRFEPGKWENDEWKEGGLKEIPIRASVQPLPFEEMITLPEGVIKEGAYALYTSTRLLTGNEVDQTPDKLTLFGDEYEVHKVSVWQNDVINHYRAVCVRVKKDKGA